MQPTGDLLNPFSFFYMRLDYYIFNIYFRLWNQLMKSIFYDCNLNIFIDILKPILIGIISI